MEDRYYNPKIEELLYALSTKELIYQRGVDGKLIAIKYFNESPIEDTIHTFIELNDCIIKNNGDDGFSRTYSIPCNQYLLKLLDKEDIESLGFELSAEYGDYIEFNDNLKSFNPRSNKILYNTNSKNMDIQWFAFENESTTPLFNGYIKNKSELKKLLIQLQLINE